MVEKPDDLSSWWETGSRLKLTEPVRLRRYQGASVISNLHRSLTVAARDSTDQYIPQTSPPSTTLTAKPLRSPTNNLLGTAQCEPDGGGGSDGEVDSAGGRGAGFRPRRTSRTVPQCDS